MSERRLVILGPGPYEGLERPSLGPEVPADVAARARELEAAGDFDGLRRIILGLARDGHDGYDLVALGGWAGSAWDFLGFDVATGEQSALRLREAPDGLNEHGLFSQYDDAESFRQAVGAGEVVPVQRVRRSAIRPGDRIHYTTGNEHKSGDAFGRVVLTIEADGAASLEHHSRAGSGAWTGHVEASAIERVRSALADSSFPSVPDERVPAGANHREIEIVTDDEPHYAMLTEAQGNRLDGYKDAIAVLELIAHPMRGGASGRPRDEGETLVTDVR